MVTIRPIHEADKSQWLRMRLALWPGTAEQHLPDIEQFFTGPRRMPIEVLVAEDAGGGLIGFAELSIRSVVESCETDQVGYLEGWYVEPWARRRGVGRSLIAAAEDWARSQRCTEFGSDAEIANEVSRRAHRALGFEETSVVRCFRKSLTAK